jgi:hypothetical protein
MLTVQSFIGHIIDRGLNGETFDKQKSFKALFSITPFYVHPGPTVREEGKVKSEGGTQN